MECSHAPGAASAHRENLTATVISHPKAQGIALL